MKNVYIPDSVKPCPRCGGENIEEDYGSLVTSLMGIDYQSGWIECHDCGYEFGFSARGAEEVDKLRETIYKGWNSGL